MNAFTTFFRSNLLNLSIFAASLLLSYKLYSYMRHGFANTNEPSTASTTALQTVASLATQEQQQTQTEQQSSESAPNNKSIKYVLAKQKNPAPDSYDSSDDLLGDDPDKPQTNNAATEAIGIGDLMYAQRKAEGPYFFFRHLLHYGKQDEAIGIIASGELCVNTCYFTGDPQRFGCSYVGITLLSIAASYNADRVIEHILNDRNLLPEMLNLTASAAFNRIKNDNKHNSLRADVPQENLTSFTPLMFAAAYRSAKAIHALLQNEAIKDAANKTDCHGNTLLGVLATHSLLHPRNFELSSSDTEVVHALVTECGVDLNNTLVACYPDRSIPNKVHKYNIMQYCYRVGNASPSLAQALLENGANFSQSDFLDFSLSYIGIDLGAERLTFLAKTKLSAVALKHVLKSSDLILEGTTLVIKYNKQLAPVDRKGKASGIVEGPETRAAYKLFLGTKLPLELIHRIHEALCIMFTQGEQEHRLELTHEECLKFERATAKNNELAK